MTEDFEEAFEFVLSMEGDYTNDSNDPGGETKFGISKKAYPSLDIKSLTLEDAKIIYKKDFWGECHCDELPREWAIAIFDMAVNQGVGIARRVLQIALKVDVDGIIGPQTISAAFKASTHTLKKFLAMRLAEYSKLMAENKNLLVFSVNWAYRVVSVAELLFT